MDHLGDAWHQTQLFSSSGIYASDEQTSAWDFIYFFYTKFTKYLCSCETNFIYSFIFKFYPSKPLYFFFPLFFLDHK